MIYLFAGHHLNDPGARAVDGTTEAQLTIEFRNLMLQFIPARSVIIDNDRETLPQLINRVRPGSGSVMLDCHFNSATATASGIETFIADGANADSRAFGADLVVTGSRLLGIPNRGVKTETESHRSRLGILHTPAGISALVELAFISNPEDLRRYHANKYALAKAYAGLLIKWDALRA